MGEARTLNREPEKTGEHRLLARTIRGIEWIGAAEIEGRIQARITDLRHREIEFRVRELNAGVLESGSIDDVLLIASDLRNIDHTRASLNLLTAQATEIDFHSSLSLLRQLRAIPKNPTFTVVASFLGRRNYNRFEIEESIAQAIREQTRWRHLATEVEQAERADLTFRVHLRDSGGWIGPRLSLMPLHRRKYKVASRTGTLHPPLAFAMAMLSGPDRGSTVLDPCCGVGTIPIETARFDSSIKALGSDLDPEVLGSAMLNAREAGQGIALTVADAGRLPLKDGSIDRIVSNPPWGRTVDARGSLTGDAGRLLEETGRVMRPGGSAVLIADSDLIEKIDPHRFGLKSLAALPISLFGAWPSIHLIVHESSPSSLPIAANGRFGNELETAWQRYFKNGA